jgi:DNA-binding MarR family transcriptional regulator
VKVAPKSRGAHAESAGPSEPTGPAPERPPACGAGGETLQQCLRKLVHLLPDLSRGLRRAQVPSPDQGLRLGPRHGSALSLLAERGALTVGVLAEELGLTLPTVSGIVADLQRAGFVERAADPADRRRIVVSLVPYSGDARDAWLSGATAPMERALGKLSPEERAAFLKGMTYLQDELDASRSAPSTSRDR